MNILSLFLISLIRFYQIISKNQSHRCLHYPSCSQYAIIALNKYPATIALRKIIKRLRNCNPFSGCSYYDYP